MCLGVPARVVALGGGGPLRMGVVDFGGVAREVCLDWVPEAKVGDHVLVHVGFAIALIDEAEAAETLRLLGELAAAAAAEDAADGGAPPGAPPERPS